jgi:hypothetical protein
LFRIQFLHFSEGGFHHLASRKTVAGADQVFPSSREA